MLRDETTTMNHRQRLRSLTYIAVAFMPLLLSGCLRVIVLEYVPSNPLKGHGAVQVEPFEYVPAQEGSVRPHEVQTNPKGIGKVFLSKEIGLVVRNALAGELRHSGYEVTPDGGMVISGRITRFYLNWVDETEKTFELNIDYTLTAGEQVVYSLTATSTQRAAKVPLAGIGLLNAALKDGLEQFIRGAQEAHAL